jgi:LmbE family N-acetylglucosaminyl deacetylase
MNGLPSSAPRHSWDVQVQTVVADADATLLSGWAQCLGEAVRFARKRGNLGAVSAVIGDARAGERVQPLRWGKLSPGAVDDWQLEELPPGTPVAEGHNRLLGAGASDLVMLVDPSASLSPSCLSELIEALTGPSAGPEPSVGLVEPRHLPFQARKPYSSVTGDVSWAATTCCLIRRQVFAATGGFDATLFPGDGAEVDLSWRARLAGWSIRHVPWAAVFLHVHDPISEPLMQDRKEAKLSKLLLVSRFAGEQVARMWATAWRVQGTEAEHLAAETFTTLAASARLPERVPGDTDVFLQELFSFESVLAADTGPYLLDAEAMSAEPASVGSDTVDGSCGGSGTSGSGSTGSGTRPPFLSVIVRTQGRRLAALQDNLLSLVSQTCQDFEVLLVGHDVDRVNRQAVHRLVDTFPAEFSQRVRYLDVAGGGRARPLNVALTRVEGTHVAFLDDDDVALDNWVGMFRQVAREHPNAVAWTEVAWQATGRAWCSGRETWPVIEAPQLFVREFDLFAHLRQNGTPSCALAVPTECFRDDGVAFREDLPVLEDWDIVLKLAQCRPFRSTGCVSALYRRGSPDNSGEMHVPADWDRAMEQILADLDAGAFVLRGEYLSQLRRSLDELDELREEKEYDEEEDEEVVETDAAVGVEVGDNSPWETSALELFGDRSVLVVSAHLDDGVLSCGELLSQLPRSIVLTVFAGDPGDWSEMTDWDLLCGFAPGIAVTAARTAEDDEALAVVGATGLRMGFLDAQYREPSISPPVEELAREIASAITSVGAEVVLFPMGLGHPDHELTARGAARAALGLPACDWFVYQDLPYAYESDDVEGALDALGNLAPRPVHLSSAGDASMKLAAIRAYSSQLVGLGQRWRTALSPEGYWRLTVPSATVPAWAQAERT